MKEAFAVEKRIIALEKKNALKERKSKKVTFKDDQKKKIVKDPYGMEGLQKVLKTMSNEMVETKKQVVETSTKKPFRNFRRKQSTEPKPTNAISNAELDLDDDEDEDTFLLSKETEEDETVECHGMWDFILANSDTESEQEALPVNTRSKNLAEPIQTSPKKKNSSSVTKDKAPMKKNSVMPTENQPSSSNPPSSSKKLVVSNSIDYNIVEDMKKNRAIILYMNLES